MQSTLQRLVKTATMIEPEEQKSVFLSFGFVFVLMAAYFILRPVRDAMASDWSNTEIAALWNLQFFLSAGLVAVYGVAVSRVPFRVLVPGVYTVFAITFVSFYFGASTLTDRVLVDKAFYLWVSLFSLFHVSVFWSFMADLFNKEQSRRLFGFIAAGASAGAALGPLVAALIADKVGADSLMLFASVMLLSVVPVVLYLQRLKTTELHNDAVQADLSAAAIGGRAVEGFKLFATNPYLLGIALFILLYTAIGSFVYFEQTSLLRDFDRDTRTQILAGLTSVVNVLTFGLGLFVTSRIVTRLGMPAALAMVPFVVAAALLVLMFAPILTVLLVLQVTRQAGNYSITRPSREMLFTHVDRESRFKAKPVIDVVVYRGGDAVTGTAFALLTDVLGMGIATMAGVGAGVALVWGTVGLYLGRAFGRRNVRYGRKQDQARAGATP